MAKHFASQNYNTVDRVVAPPEETLATNLVDIGQGIIKQSQEARINENLSKAQLELGQLQNQFQIKYEADPFNKDGLAEFSDARQNVLSKYGSDISPLYGRAWNDGAKKLTDLTDAHNQTWGYQQSTVNTKASIDSSMKSTLAQAQLDGENFGNSDATEIGSFTNYVTSRQRLQEFGAANIGEVSTKKLLGDFDQDAAKMFISGVAKSNPVKALKVMDTMVPGVQQQAQAQEAGNFTQAMAVVAQNEGGPVEVDGASKAPAIYGINQKAHPEEYAAAKKITDEQGDAAGHKYAEDFYKKEYWDKNDVGDLPANTQTIVFDGLINHTTAFGKKLIKAARNGASPADLIDMRREEYTRLKDANPEKYGKSFDGWMNRMDKLEAGSQQAPAGAAAPGAPGQTTASGIVTDPAEWAKFRSSIETLAMKSQEQAKEREVVNALKGENALLSNNRPLSYAEAQQATQNMSDQARLYFFKKNGFEDPAEVPIAKGGSKPPKEPKEPKLNAEEKLQFKSGVYDQIIQMSQNEKIDPAQVSALQEKIYEGMRKGAITQETGASFITQLIEPTLAQKEKQMEDYSGTDWNPFNNDVGLESLQAYYADKVEIKPATDQKKVGPVSAMLNAQNKSKLYDAYYEALGEKAAAFRSPQHPNGLKINEIPTLSYSQSNKIYAEAQDAAQNRFRGSSPKLQAQQNIPLAAIKMLQDSPDTAPQFDEMFGNGAANRVLGK